MLRKTFISLSSNESLPGKLALPYLRIRRFYINICHPDRIREQENLPRSCVGIAGTLFLLWRVLIWGGNGIDFTRNWHYELHKIRNELARVTRCRSGEKAFRVDVSAWAKAQRLLLVLSVFLISKQVSHTFKWFASLLPLENTQDAYYASCKPPPQFLSPSFNLQKHCLLMSCKSFCRGNWVCKSCD